MKQIAMLLIIALVLMVGTPKRVNAGDACPPLTESGGTPPCCADDATLIKVRAVELKMMADTSHERVAFIDCELHSQGSVQAEFVGTLRLTQISINAALTSNTLMLHSHNLSTVPSVEDMQTLHDLNPLEFWLIGYDHIAQIWLRCRFRKTSWLDAWPIVDKAEASRLYQRINRYYAQAQGDNWTRWEAAYQQVWSEWAAEHEIALTCETIT